jgi:ABC-type nitrate/sulfonate/bicarbonate transport system substrate-binding protein
MKLLRVLQGLCFVAALLQIAPAHVGAQPLKKLNISYTATSPYQAVVVIGKEAGIFRKYGLDVTLIFMAGGSLGIQAGSSASTASTSRSSSWPAARSASKRW